jgi:integrase/recombinase XerD
MELSEIVDEFARRRTVASSSGSDSSAERYRREILPPGDYDRDVAAWAPWISEERESSLWNADSGCVRSYLRDLSRAGYAASTIQTRRDAVSLFYKESYKMVQEGGYELPEDLLERCEAAEDIDNANPAHEIDLSDFGLSGNSSTATAEGLRGNDQVAYITPDEFDALDQSVPAPETQNRLAVRLLYDTGIRRSELIKLQLPDINRDERTITVPPVKSDTGRTVVFDGWLDALFTEWLDRGRRKAVAGSDSLYLFPSQRGVSEHISALYVTNMVKESAESAGIQSTVAEYVDGREISKVTPHTLRHSHGVRAVQCDIDVRTLQKLMGHEDITTTERYLDLAEDDIIDRARRFTPGI